VATRTAYDAVSGTVLTAANLDKHAGGWIGYNEVTTSQTPFTTITDATSLSLTVTVNSSRKVRISGYVGFTSSTATDVCTLQITDGSNNVLQVCNVLMGMTTIQQAIAYAAVVLNPSSGSNTWKLRIARTGAGTATMVAASTNPCWILVEDIGPSS
jgi:hypothetical protein